MDDGLLDRVDDTLGPNSLDLDRLPSAMRVEDFVLVDYPSLCCASLLCKSVMQVCYWM